jgi:hypothetical protein
MSALASCGRDMLRRSVAQTGKIAELSKHVAEQCEANAPFGWPNSEDVRAPVLVEFLADLRSLDSAVKHIENVHNDTHKMMDQLGSLVKIMPSNQSPERLAPENLRQPVSVRNGIPDTPTYNSFQKELALVRQLNTDVNNSDLSQCEASKPSTDSVRAQLEEARASNQMMQRALVAIQVIFKSNAIVSVTTLRSLVGSCAILPEYHPMHLFAETPPSDCAATPASRRAGAGRLAKRAGLALRACRRGAGRLTTRRGRAQLSAADDCRAPGHAGERRRRLGQAGVAATDCRSPGRPSPGTTPAGRPSLAAHRAAPRRRRRRRLCGLRPNATRGRARRRRRFWIPPRARGAGRREPLSGRVHWGVTRRSRVPKLGQGLWQLRGRQIQESPAASGRA